MKFHARTSKKLMRKSNETNMKKPCFSACKLWPVVPPAFTACALYFAALAPVSGATLALKNSSFEEPALAGEGRQFTNVVPGWALAGSAGVFLNNGAFGSKPADADGAQLAFLNGTQNSALTQDVTAQIEPLTAYTLTAKIGLRKDTPLTNGASLLLRLQSYDTATSNRFRTLAIKEIQVGRELLSDEKLGEFTATFTSGTTAPKGGLRVMISVGEKRGKTGDWTVDQVRLEAKAAAPEVVIKLNAGPATVSAKKTVSYNRDIRPVLSENCFSCHGPDSGSRKAGLRLDRFEDATATRKGVVAIVPGQPEKGEIMSRLLTTDPDDLMPPHKTNKKLTPAQIAMIRTWIAEGAEYELHWAYLTPTRPPLPAVQNAKWARNPIDRFVLARLEKEGLPPAPEADRRTLARRLSLDLTGLPPEPEVVEAFVKDKSAEAYEKLVDQFMASKHWGEHRGRYWLDAARYADTHGIHFDNFREMWTFRDWVFNAFNVNMPFSQFTLEQLAGDLLPSRTLDQQVASGFNRSHITSNEGGLIDEEYLVLYMKDRNETAAAVWMGMTANCATCHDHKFDPLTQRETYELAAFFNNSTVTAKDGNRRDPPPIINIPSLEDRARSEKLAVLQDEAKQKAADRLKELRTEFDGWLKKATPATFSKLVPQEQPHLHAALNEGEGTKLEFTVKGAKHSLDAGANAAWGPGQVAAQAFQAAKGANVELADAGDFDTKDAFSYGAWLKVEAKDVTGTVFARMEDTNKVYRGWDLYLDNGRPATHLAHKWPADALKIVGKEKLKVGDWAHVFVTYDGSAKIDGLKLFVNGQPAEVEQPNKKLNAANSIRTAAPFTLGQRATAEHLQKTLLQDARIYTRQLKSEEVAGLVRGTRGAWLAQLPAAKRSPAENGELFDGWLPGADTSYRDLQKNIATLAAEDAVIKKRSAIAHVMSEKSEEAMAYVLFRGEYDRRRDRVLAGTPKILPPMPEELPRNRLGFAQWLLRPEHPLTARVTVNRFWQEVFGTGLVKSSGDFGIAGEQPSHPELLDWMAVEFREGGWDVKKFFKLIVTSAAYRQAATTTPEKLQKDPSNRLGSRGPRFRMDAEMVRDHALSASGLLVPKIGGPSVKPYQPDGVWEAVAMPESNTKKYERDTGEKLYRRSVYTFWKRAAPPASMDIFNAPNRETCTVRRERTDTPLQALVTLNDPQFIEAARVLAQKAIKQGGASAAGRLDFIAQQLLARPLRPDEQKIAGAVLKDLLAYYESAPKDAEALLAVGESKPDAALAKPELAAYTMAVNQLMNLDEVLNK